MCVISALAKSGNCGFEYGLQDVKSKQWKQLDPAQNTPPIRRKQFLSSGITSYWCTETVSMFELQIIGKQDPNQLLKSV